MYSLFVGADQAMAHLLAVLLKGEEGTRGSGGGCCIYRTYTQAAGFESSGKLHRTPTAISYPTTWLEDERPAPRRARSSPRGPGQGGHAESDCCQPGRLAGSWTATAAARNPSWTRLAAIAQFDTDRKTTMRCRRTLAPGAWPGQESLCLK